MNTNDLNETSKSAAISGPRENKVIAAKTSPRKKVARKTTARRNAAGRLSSADAVALAEAVDYLESEGLIVRLSAALGETAESLLVKIPARFAELLTRGYTGVVQTVTDKALQGALWVAAQTTRDPRQRPSWDRSHKWGVAITGAVGGFFGMAGAAVEVPITTVIMLRSILDIARHEGADIRDPETRIECLNVLALGGPSSDDDNVETEYFLARAGLANLGAQAARYLASRQGKKAALKVAGKLAQYLSKIGMRYAPIVAEKLSVEGVPLVGALAGAVINAGFIHFFQDIARGHFVVLRLEKKYGAEVVREEFDRLRQLRIRPRRNSDKLPSPDL